MSEILGTRYYVAPEIIDKRIKYGFGCDIWAVGVMLYITVTDEHPCAKDGFELTTAQLWKKVVSKDQIRQQPLKDARVDQCLKHLLFGLLEKDKDRRPTAQQVLEHEWFQGLREQMQTTPADGGGNRKDSFNLPQQSFSQGSIESSKSNSGKLPDEHILNRTRTYRQASNFEKALLTIASYQEASEELDNLKEIFMGLDTAGNGTISRQELAQGFRDAGMKVSSAEVESLFKALDADGTGKVHFTEWLAGTIHPAEIASDKAIDDVFNFFDLDRSGRVHRDELCQVLGCEATASQVLRRADAQGRSYLTKDDFSRIMKELAGAMDERNNVTLQKSDNGFYLPLGP